jgi:hypothetical protein
MSKFLRAVNQIGWKETMKSYLLYNALVLFIKRLVICSRHGHDKDEWICFTCFKEMK